MTGWLIVVSIFYAVGSLLRFLSTVGMDDAMREEWEGRRR